MSNLEFGQMPSMRDFMVSFQKIVSDGKYGVRGHPVLGTREFSAIQLWGLLRKLCEKYAKRGDTTAATIAQQILASLGFQWNAQPHRSTLPKR